MTGAARFVPIGARSLLDGKRLPVEDRDRQALGDEPCLHIGGTNARIVYRLDAADPCDQREIWRLAALALRASEEGAIRSQVGFDRLDFYTERRTNVLVRRLKLPSRWIAQGEIGERDLAGATLALCAYVWGPE